MFIVASDKIYSEYLKVVQVLWKKANHTYTANLQFAIEL